MTPETAALRRAMPFTRLIDCGMDTADARRLLAATADGASWEQFAADIAEQQCRRSLAAEQAGHLVTAGETARRAVAALTFAQMARNGDDATKCALYTRQVAAMERVAMLSRGAIERVEIVYGAGLLVGWRCLPESRTAAATVLVWGGLSGWGAAYLPVADALNRRGLACVLVEGPGQGESRLLHGVYADERLVVGFARFVDLVLDDPRLGGRVGVQGNSFGGLFAALLASEDDRVGACVVNGAPSTPVVPPFRSPREQVLALLGLSDLLGSGDAESAEQVLARLRFDPGERRIGCPLLVLHGGADPLVTREEQAVFVAAGEPSTSELRVWDDGEHTLYNHADERNALTADWFADQLAAH